MQKRKILFLGESYRADAITWMKGLKEFGNFEIITWELKTPNTTFLNRIKRVLEFSFAIFTIKKLAIEQQPDMVIAERTTSYGFLAALSGIKPVAIAQQGRTDLWPEDSLTLPFKRIIQNYAFQKATLIHAWGPIMTISMKEANVNMDKVLVLSKGINLEVFKKKDHPQDKKITAVVTRSLLPEYSHITILKAFEILNQKGIDFVLTIVGDGKELERLKTLAVQLHIDKKVCFTGRIPNTDLPFILQQSNFYISMPITEGVSASLFEAMSAGCYPVVTDIAGNQSWIRHRENGQLVRKNDYKMLAEELLWSFKNPLQREKAIAYNRNFAEQNMDYRINMKIIAERYHELINTTKK